jgi:hypothetical protein
MAGFGLATGLALAMQLLAAPRAAVQEANPKQTATAEAAPVPEQMRTAKRVFIGNAGEDGISNETFSAAGDINQPYNRFYAAMKSWGRYELVGAPADADLVMEIRFGAPLADCGRTPVYKPYMQLSVLDAKTHFQLWSITARVNGAFLKCTWNKNVEKGAANLVEGLKKVAGDSAASGSPAS